MVMLSPALTKEEGERYSMLFDKYPKLFATEYTQMRGTYSVLHEIILHGNAKLVP